MGAGGPASGSQPLAMQGQGPCAPLVLAEAGRLGGGKPGATRWEESGPEAPGPFIPTTSH